VVIQKLNKLSNLKEILKMLIENLL
jgi:hypothetical protein